MEPSSLSWPSSPDLGQQEVALVAVALGRGQGLGSRPGSAVVLPLVEPADQRLHVGVAEVLHGLGREGRPHPAGAVDDDRARLVGQLALDLELEVAPGQVDGVGDGALLVLVGLADVEERDAALLEQRLRVGLAPPRGWTPWPRCKRSRGVGTLLLRHAPATSRPARTNRKTLPAGSTFPVRPGGRRAETADRGTARGHPPPGHGAGASRPSRSTGRRRPPRRCGRCAPRPPATPGYGVGRPRGPGRRPRSTGTPPPTRPGARAHPEWCGRACGGRRWCSWPTRRPTGYVARYAEPDKAASGSGRGRRGLAGPLLVSATPPSASWRSSWVRSTPASAPASSAPSEARPAGGGARVPGRLAAVLRRRARPARRGRPPLHPRSAGARPPASTRASPRALVTRAEPRRRSYGATVTRLESLCSGPPASAPWPRAGPTAG